MLRALPPSAGLKAYRQIGRSCLHEGPCETWDMRVVCVILTGQGLGGCGLYSVAFASGCVCSRAGPWHPREPGSGRGQSSEVAAGWERVERAGTCILDVLKTPTDNENGL